MEEIWKEIKGYPNYQVSNMGRVKSLGKSKTAYGFIWKYEKEKVA